MSQKVCVLFLSLSQADTNCIQNYIVIYLLHIKFTIHFQWIFIKLPSVLMT